MNKVISDVYQPLNTKLLAKREETEKLILNEQLKVKALLTEKQKTHKKITLIVENLQEESNGLINQSAILSGETTHLKHNITQSQNSVQELLCKIDEIRPKQLLANMVQEKEQRTLQLFYDKMEYQKINLQEFWKNGLDDSEILELKNKKRKLLEKQEVLQNQIDWFNDNCPEVKIVKLSEECMILRKRNAAFLKRKTRILEQLDRKVKEKREEIAIAKRNMTFKTT